MGSDFADLWATIRQQMSAMEISPMLRNDVVALAGLVSNDQERFRAAAVRVQFGVLAGLDDVKRSGLTELRFMPSGHIREMLSSFPDLTILEPPRERWLYLEPIIKPLLEPGDPAVDFIRFPTSASAKELVEREWAPATSLPANLQAELKLQVGWAAMEHFIERRCEESKRLVFAQALRLRLRVEPGWWEQQLQKALVTLADGDEPGGVGLVDAIWSGNPPRWARDRVAYTVARFGGLASRNPLAWIASAGGSLPDRRQASGGSDRAAISVTDMITDRLKATEQSVADLAHELESFPWIAFAGFCNSGIKPGARAAFAKSLLRLDRSEFAEMHWGAREHQFSEHLLDVRSKVDALELGSRAFDATRDKHVAAMLARLADEVPARQIIGTDIVSLALRRTLETVAPQLSRRRAALLARGGTFRAVIDGSNVMWGGLDREHDGKPRFELLEQAIADLTSAGFEEVIVYVDARTKHDLDDSSRKRFERMRNDYVISSVHRHADPHVVEAFLKDPNVSEMVTCDQYRNIQKDPVLGDRLKATKRDKWRRFHLGRGGSLEWDTPLDRRPRDV